MIYTAGSGDMGYNFNGNPESLDSVVSVGSTQLLKSGSKYSESIWDGAGGGCSNNGSGTGVPKPSWQKDPDCAYRTDADIAAVADGVAEYDTYGGGGWFTVGGTSVATPLIAGVFALAGNASSQDAGKASGPQGAQTPSRPPLHQQRQRWFVRGLVSLPSGHQAVPHLLRSRRLGNAEWHQSLLMNEQRGLDKTLKSPEGCAILSVNMFAVIATAYYYYGRSESRQGTLLL